jgi:hypothetical protein
VDKSKQALLQERAHSSAPFWGYFQGLHDTHLEDSSRLHSQGMISQIITTYLIFQKLVRSMNCIEGWRFGFKMFCTLNSWYSPFAYGAEKKRNAASDLNCYDHTILWVKKRPIGVSRSVVNEKWLGSSGWYHGTWDFLAKSSSIRICSTKNKTLSTKYMHKQYILIRKLIKQPSLEPQQAWQLWQPYCRPCQTWKENFISNK